MNMWMLVLCLGLLLAGCSRVSIGIIGGADGPTKIIVSESAQQTQKGETKMNYQTITPEEAKAVMDGEPSCIILDVREQEEYDQGHIPGAVLMPHARTRELAPELVPDRDATVLVYCRSGRRSKLAAQTLADMGYTDVREFGGILDWPYDITK